MSTILNKENCPFARGLYENAANSLQPNPRGFETVETIKKYSLIAAKAGCAVIGIVEIVFRKLMELGQKGINLVLTPEQQKQIIAKISQLLNQAKEGVLSVYNKHVSPLFA